MRFFFLTSVAVLGLACEAQARPKVPMFFNLFGPMEWNEDHWEGQNFRPLIENPQYTLPAAQNRDQALFGDASGLSPDDFIARLIDARIITGVHNEKNKWFGTTGNVVVELGQNFYSLSYTDRHMIAELIARSYEHENYILKDFLTKKVVGTITPYGLNLY